MRKAASILGVTFVFFFTMTFRLLADVGPDEPKPAPKPAPAAPAPAPAQTSSYQTTVTTTYESSDRKYNAGDKLARGLVNILCSPLELPRNVQNMTEQEGVLVGWTAGVAQGIGMTALRIITGAYEVITFPLPFPENYVPVIEPEYVWQAKGPKITPQGEPSK